MKKLIIVAAFSLIGLSIQAQTIGKVTKVTAATATTGTIVLEDTTAGLKEYLPLRRGDAYIKLSGAGTTARLSAYTKNGMKLIWGGPLSAVYVVGAGGNPSTQTGDQKLTYLKANTY